MRKKWDLGEWSELGELDPSRVRRRQGNARILRVTRDGHNHFVMKVPYRQVKQAEPYQRFENEVRILSELSGMVGVVEVIDSRLPERPSKGTPGYYVMPIMRSVREAMEDAGVEEVLDGIAQVATTLATLWDQRRLAHRDLKPENLFLHDGRWVIGDFGLVKVPEFPAITESGKKIGPMWYIAPELVNPRGEPDYHASDVYSLAKTLWVLVTGQNYPIHGSHLTYPEWASSLFSFSSYRDMPRDVARMLDSLLERSTHMNPDARPRMQAFAHELRLMTRRKGDRQEMQPPDILELGKRIQDAVRPDVAEADLRRERRRQVDELIAQVLRPLLQPIEEILTSALSPSFKVLLDSRNTALPMRYARAAKSPIGASGGIAVVARFEPKGRPCLFCGFLVHIGLDGNIYLQVGHHTLVVTSGVPPEEVPSTVWSDYVEVPHGSAQEANVIQRFARELVERLPEAMDALAREAGA